MAKATNEEIKAHLEEMLDDPRFKIKEDVIKERIEALGKSDAHEYGKDVFHELGRRNRYFEKREGYSH